jgi:hypothetical protein
VTKFSLNRKWGRQRVQRIFLEQFEQIQGKKPDIQPVFLAFFFFCGKTLSCDKKIYMQRVQRNFLEKFAKIHHISREKVLKANI